jgi:hypothetical protein
MVYQCLWRALCASFTSYYFLLFLQCTVSSYSAFADIWRAVCVQWGCELTNVLTNQRFFVFADGSLLQMEFLTLCFNVQANRYLRLSAGHHWDQDDWGVNCPQLFLFTTSRKNREFWNFNMFRSSPNICIAIFFILTFHLITSAKIFSRKVALRR